MSVGVLVEGIRPPPVGQDRHYRACGAGFWNASGPWLEGVPVEASDACGLVVARCKGQYPGNGSGGHGSAKITFRVLSPKALGKLSSGPARHRLITTRYDKPVDCWTRENLTSRSESSILTTVSANPELFCIGPDIAASAVDFRAGARPATWKVVAFIDQYRDRFGVEPICRVLRERNRPHPQTGSPRPHYPPR